MKETPEEKTKKPCIECPFKKSSLPGYLGSGSHDPVGFLATIEHSPLPCHMAVDWENDDDVTVSEAGWSTPCQGSLQYMNNSLKLPRDPEYALLVRRQVKSAGVFNWKHEFCKHHSISHERQRNPQA